MITLRDHHSRDLFDPWEYLGEKRRQLLDRSWAGVFRDHLLENLPVKEVTRQFREEVGRPSKDLHVALGALILQQLHDLTDEQTVEAIALNIAWHYALDIRNKKKMRTFVNVHFATTVRKSSSMSWTRSYFDRSPIS